MKRMFAGTALAVLPLLQGCSDAARGEAAAPAAPAWTERLDIRPGKYQCRIGIDGGERVWRPANHKLSREFRRIGSLAWECAIEGPESTVCIWKKPGAPDRCYRYDGT